MSAIIDSFDDISKAAPEPIYLQIKKTIQQRIASGETLDDLARAAGIQTGRAGWWDLFQPKQIEKLVARIKKLRKKAKGA